MHMIKCRKHKNISRTKFMYALLLLGILGYYNGHAQEALHNYGNLKIHDNGAMGFHHDLINDGTTDDNRGLAGFYSNNDIVISLSLIHI